MSETRIFTRCAPGKSVEQQNRKTPMRRFALVLGLLLASIFPAQAEDFLNATSGANSPAAVLMCWTTGRYYQPCGPANPISVAIVTGSGATVTPIASTALESNHVLKASAGTFYSVTVTTGVTAGYVMVFNATSAPADGAVTPLFVSAAPANSTTSLSMNGSPGATFSTGIVVVFSTTGPLTKTASATAAFTGMVQ